MKKGLLLGLVLLASGAHAQVFKTSADSVAYLKGVEIASMLESEGLKDLSIDIVKQGIKDALNKKTLLLDPIANASFYKKELNKYSQLKMEENKIAGINFLKEKATEAGVLKLDEGILYEVLKSGSGPNAQPNTDVTLHYEGRLIDGRVFDSSIERGEPITFNLGRLIKGWQIAVPNMKVGDKWRIYLPYEVAYGDRAAGPLIKPYSALIFDIELLGI